MPRQSPLHKGEAEADRGFVQSHPASQDSNPGILHFGTMLVGLETIWHRTPLPQFSPSWNNGNAFEVPGHVSHIAWCMCLHLPSHVDWGQEDRSKQRRDYCTDKSPRHGCMRVIAGSKPRVSSAGTVWAGNFTNTPAFPCNFICPSSVCVSQSDMSLPHTFPAPFQFI